MTTSTDAKTVPPQKKPPGPIRTGAVVPTLIVFLLTYLYFHFFFDGHLRRAAEWTAGYVHGAEVNIADIDTSFFGGSFRLQGLEVTDKARPTHNIFALGEIRFKFVWDALLRLKFVVDEAAIESVAAMSPRKSAGWVKPPEPPDGQPSLVEKIEQNAINQAKDRYQGCVLGDIAQIMGGTDEKEILKNIQGQLQAEKFIGQLEATLKEKQKFWEDKIAKLPRKEEFDALNARAKALKFDSKNPSQLAKDLKELKSILKEADQKVDEIKSTGKGIESDSAKLKAEIDNVDDLIKKDIADIENRMKIGGLNVGDFSKDLFGRMFGEKIASVQKYATVAKQYLPPPKDPAAEAEQIVPRKRGAGEDVHFPVMGGYPLFWLKRAAISSTATPEGFSGNIKGELTDVSSDPHIIPNPLFLRVAGNFPNQQIDGVDLQVTLDHRTDIPKQSIDLKVGSYPVSAMQLANDSSVQLGIEKAGGSTHFMGALENKQFTIQARNEFSNIGYKIEAQSKVMNEALTNILNGIPKVTLDASAEGTFEKFETHLSSNLGRELKEGLERFVKAKVDEMKQKIRAQIDEKIKGKREELRAEFEKVRAQTEGVVKEKRAELEKAKDEISSQSNSKKSDATGKAKADMKKKGKDLLKKLKF